MSCENNIFLYVILRYDYSLESLVNFTMQAKINLDWHPVVSGDHDTTSSSDASTLVDVGQLLSFRAPADSV